MEKTCSCGWVLFFYKHNILFGCYNGVNTQAKVDSHINHRYPLICNVHIFPISPLLKECLCCCFQVNYIVYKDLNTQVHIEPLKRICEVSHTYQLGCLRYREKHANYILFSCRCTLLFKTVVHMVVMWLELAQSLMVISTTL